MDKWYPNIKINKGDITEVDIPDMIPIVRLVKLTKKFKKVFAEMYNIDKNVLRDMVDYSHEEWITDMHNRSFNWLVVRPNGQYICCLSIIRLGVLPSYLRIKISKSCTIDEYKQAFKIALTYYKQYYKGMPILFSSVYADYADCYEVILMNLGFEAYISPYGETQDITSNKYKVFEYRACYYSGGSGVNKDTLDLYYDLICKY